MNYNNVKAYHRIFNFDFHITFLVKTGSIKGSSMNFSSTKYAMSEFCMCVLSIISVFYFLSVLYQIALKGDSSMNRWQILWQYQICRSYWSARCLRFKTSSKLLPFQSWKLHLFCWLNATQTQSVSQKKMSF